MGKTDDAAASQLANIEARTGVPIAELVARVRAAGLEKHGQMVAWLKTEMGLGHGDANLLAHVARKSDEPEPTADPIDELYSGKKAPLRPLHDALMERIATLGDDIEHSPKKTYLSLRRARQFATVGPAARNTVEVGVNLKGAPADDRMEALPEGRMCTHRTRLASPDELDEALMDWLRRAYDAAG